MIKTSPTDVVFSGRIHMPKRELETDRARLRK